MDLAFAVLLMCWTTGILKAIDLSPCGTDNTVEVVENKNTTVTCRNIPDDYTVEWLVALPSITSLVGTCQTVGSCTPFTAVGYTASRPQSDTSIMTIDPTRNADWVRNGRLFCKVSKSPNNYNTSCRLDIVYPASVTPVSVQHTAGTWNATGSVTITKVNSSLGRYSCQWYRGTSQASQPDILSNQPYTTSEIQGDPDYRSGTCDFTAAILPTSGTYYYRVVVTPGGTQRVSGPVTVVKANSPTITGCPSETYVRENSSITCRCTANVGTPPGHLVWRKITPTTNNIINTGNVSLGQLDMTPQTLTRHDHNVTKFRCDVQWAVLVEGNTYTARVGYGPQATTLTLNSRSGNLTVMENESVVFDCQGNGRPTPNMVLVNQDSGVKVNKSQSSPLSHTVSRVRCEDAAVYACAASNGIGTDQQTTGTLHVNCKPRSDLSSLPTLNYNNQTVTQSFDVIASPVPHQFTFTFNGPNVSSDSPGQEVKDANLSAACVSVPESLYKSICYLTVFSINSPSAVGFYTVRVANTHGHQDFTFQLTTDETPRQKRESEGSPQPVAIALGVSAAVVVVVTIVLVVVFLRRRNKEPDTQKLHNSVEHEYGNVTLSMAPAGNSIADTEKTGNKKTKKSADGGAARKPNQDGLLYTMVDFSGQRQQSTKPAPPHDQQGVVYSDVLFNTSITKQ